MISTEKPILQTVIDRGSKAITPEIARMLLNWNFSEQENARMDELAAKSKEGTLTDRDQETLQEFVTTGELLMLLHLLAREALGQLPKG